MTKEQAREILMRLISGIPLKREDYLALEKAIDVLYKGGDK